jgi:hypothetical protein
MACPQAGKALWIVTSARALRPLPQHFPLEAFREFVIGHVPGIWIALADSDGHFRGLFVGLRSRQSLATSSSSTY